MNSVLNYNGYLCKLSKSDLEDLYCYLEKYRIKNRECLDIPLENSFGVEIEFGNIPLVMAKAIIHDNREYRDWWPHEDISTITIKNGVVLGGEISSEILHDTEDEWQLLNNLLKELKRVGAKATDKTASHIHVGAQIFDEDIIYLRRFVKVWCIFEDIIFRFGYGKSSKHRTHINDFASPIAPIYQKLYTKNRNIFDELTTTTMFDFGKQRAVSFKNYHYLSSEEEINNTIEIRCPNGTLDFNIIQNNINFFLKLMLYVTSDKYDDKLINRLFQKLEVKSLEEYSEFNIKKALILCDMIFEDSLDKINFLKQYVKKEDFSLIRRV